MPNVTLFSKADQSQEVSYSPRTCFERFAADSFVYAKVTHVFPDPEGEESPYDSMLSIAVGDVVLVGMWDDYEEGLVIWLNDGGEMSFDEAGNMIRVTPLGKDDAINITFN